MSNSSSFKRRMIRLQTTKGWDRSLQTRWVLKQRRRGQYASRKRAAERRIAEVNSGQANLRNSSALTGLAV